MSHDILSDVLRSVRLRGALFYHVSGGRSWVAEAPASRDIAAAVMPESEHVMEYHVITRGSCWGAIVGEQPVCLDEGDVVLFPHGDAHVMSSAPGMRANADVPGYFDRKVEQLPFILRVDDDTKTETQFMNDGETRLVCGFLGCDVRPFNPLIATLPRILHFKAKERDLTAQLMLRAVTESKEKRPGGEAMLERMSEMMFVDAVRRYVDTLPGDSRGWLAGLRDRFVGRALSFMHDEPAYPWTVDELGRRIGLSRSALHERFNELIGQPPMQYLANWRMQVGAGLLRNTNATVASIAQDVGYESEAAFAKAFKRLVGSPPAAWRKQVTRSRRAESHRAVRVATKARSRPMRAPPPS